MVQFFSIGTYLATVPDSYFDSGKAEDVKQFSQELRLRWDDGRPLRLEGGVYYLREKIRRAEDVNFLFPDFQAITEFAFAMAFGGTPASPFPGSNHTVTTSPHRHRASLKNRHPIPVALSVHLRLAFDVTPSSPRYVATSACF